MQYKVYADHMQNQDAIWVMVLRYDMDAKTSEYAVLHENCIEWVFYNPYDMIQPFVVLNGMIMAVDPSPLSLTIGELLKRPRAFAQYGG